MYKLIIFHIYAHNLLLWAVAGENEGIEYFIYTRCLIFIYIYKLNTSINKNNKKISSYYALLSSYLYHLKNNNTLCYLISIHIAL